MFFIPYLPCKNCPHRIQLPIPTVEPDKRRTWPWGSTSTHLLCPSCKQINLYWFEECRWNNAESQSEPSAHIAMRQIDIPCGKEKCPEMLHVFAALPVGTHLDEAANIVELIDLNGLACERGHRNYGWPKHPAIRCGNPK
jgi:hypothetical protein